METTVFLLRHGDTDYSRERRILGRRDIGLNADGLNQAHAAAMALTGLDVTEVISSPLLRAVQTAEIVAGLFDIDVARDPRLGEANIGRWEGMPHEAVVADPEYQRFIDDPEAVRIPGGDRLGDVRDHALAAVRQALSDNPGGAHIVVVSHATVIRVLLANYAGAPLAGFHRLRVCPGAFSVLRFSDDRELPRILAVNHPSSMSSLLR